MTALPTGPTVTAAMAIGITLRVITSGPIGIEPIGVNEKIIVRAVINPSITNDFVLTFVFILNFLLVIIPPSWEDTIQYQYIISHFFAYFHSLSKFFMNFFIFINRNISTLTNV